jgi:signal transduction histidine kinase
MNFKNSIRRRLLINLGLSMLALLTTVGFLVNNLHKKGMLELFDRALFEKARTFTTLVEWEDGWIEVNYEEDSMPEFLGGSDAQYFQVLAGNEVISFSASLESDDEEDETEVYENSDLDDHLDSEDDAEDNEDENEVDENSDIVAAMIVADSGFHDLELADDRDGRCVILTFMPLIQDKDPDAPPEELTEQEKEEFYFQGEVAPLRMIMARERESLDKQLAQSSQILFIGMGSVWLMMIIFLSLLIRRNLSPLSLLAKEVKLIGSESLDHRIGSKGLEIEELSPIINQINNLLARIESAFRREKQFSAHVAHELRTPVAELRSLAAVSQRFIGNSNKLRPLLEDLESLGSQMQEMIISLLSLARSENETSDLKQLAVEFPSWLIALEAEFDESCRGSLEWQDSATLIVYTDPAALRMLFRNLVCNAVQHGIREESIKISWRAERNTVTLQVSNSAPVLAKDDLDKLTNRFWRGDSSRKEDGHLGLGLSICRALAAKLQLQLELELSDEQEFKASIKGLKLDEPAL